MPSCRRRHDQPEAERFRLSEEARKIQERLSYYRAWTQGESKTVGQAYLDLVTELRKVAWAHVDKPCIDEPCKTDADMNIGTQLVDLSMLDPSKTPTQEPSTPSSHSGNRRGDLKHRGQNAGSGVPR